MFKIRRDQLAVLAKHYAGQQLVSEFASRDLQATWDEAAGAVVVSDPKGNATRFTLDDRGRIAQGTTPLGRTYRFGYDAEHRLVEATWPGGLTLTWDYDPSEGWIGLSRGLGRRWTLETDPWGNPAKVVFPDQTSWQMTADGRDRYTSYTDRAGQTTRLERDEDGRLEAIVDPKGNRTSFHYQEWDRPSRIIRADGSREEIGRNAAGRISDARIDDQPWARIAWDNAGRIEEIRYADGHFVAFVYDGAGRVVEARNPATVVLRQYDDQGRLIEEDQGGQVVRYNYDPSGLLETLTTPSGEILKFSYDADGRLIGVEDWDRSTHAISYEDAGRTIRHQFPNGIVAETRLLKEMLVSELRVTSQSAALSASYEYDQNDRVSSYADSELGRRLFSYDPEGGVLGVEDPLGHFNERFAYDACGNRTIVGTETAEFDALNRMTRQGQSRMVYDARGNLIEKVGPEGTTSYRYDGQNLLMEVILPEGIRVEFAYDAFARRISKTVGGTKTRFVWANDQLLSELSEGGAQPVRQDYLFLPGSFVPLSLRRNGITYQYHTDPKGTPRWLTDASGEVAWSASVTAFGQAVTLTEVIRQPLRFPGHYYDEETQLHYNRARYYSPSLGRYLSSDPMDLVSGLNFYVYADNDPVNGMDPLGLLFGWVKKLAAAAIVAVGVAVVVVAAPAVLAVAAGAAAFSATTVAMGAAAVVGGGAIGMGIGLGLAPDGCIECQISAMKHGFLAGAGATLAVLSMGAGVLMGGGGAALALTGGGTLGAGGAAAVITSATNIAIGAAAVTSGTAVLMTGAGQGGGSGDEEGEGEEEDVGQRRGEKGRSFRGGKKSTRDNWYGHNDKDFQRWWHRVGKEEYGGQDIDNAQQAEEAYQDWVSRGKPKVK